MFDLQTISAKLQLLKTNMATLSYMLQDELTQPADAFAVRELSDSAGSI